LQNETNILIYVVNNDESTRKDEKKGLMTTQSKTLMNVTCTPLASIFGSGFLVIVPILAGAVGVYSVFAMAGVCALAYAVGSVIRYNITLFDAQPHTPRETLTLVAGTLIVVQGFETTRYLGKDFDAKVRISASRWSQIISTVVYLVFIAVAMPLVHTLNSCELRYINL
jgi:hypothetical protein